MKKKIKSGEGFSIGGKTGLGFSIGEALGLAAPKSAEPANSGGEAAAGAKAGVKDGAAGADAAAKMPPRVSLQSQRAGRGGKTVTLVTLPQDWRGDREALAKELRKGLGCGSSMEEGKIVLQGDICDRAESWFLKKGVKKVNRG